MTQHETIVPRTDRRQRGQTTLPALAVAMVILTAVTGLGIAVADAAITGAERPADERRAAASIAGHLVDSAGPLANRSNVLDRDRVSSFDAAALARSAPPAREYAVRVTVNGTVIAASDEVRDGVTIRRLVLVERTERRTIEPTPSDGTTATLPRRASSARLTIDPPAGTSVWTVRANERVVLHDASGLAGTFTVSLVPYETTRIQFQYAGRLHPGNVTIEYDATRTAKATLAVTVDE